MVDTLRWLSRDGKMVHNLKMGLSFQRVKYVLYWQKMKETGKSIELVANSMEEMCLVGFVTLKGMQVDHFVLVDASNRVTVDSAKDFEVRLTVKSLKFCGC